jgi:methylated-DNA-[protein]-cysteine S-methyltransferase
MTTETNAAATWHTVVPTALGDLTLVRDVGALLGLYFPRHWYRPDPATFGPPSDEGFDQAIRQLQEYLAGQRQDFDLPLAPRGDDFQHQVWSLIQQVPHGETVTYGELAGRIGGAVTAQQVGAAVGRNPLSIFIACHRVIGADGKLTGYAGGLRRKRYLLELERDQLAQPSPNQKALFPALW